MKDPYPETADVNDRVVVNLQQNLEGCGTQGPAEGLHGLEDKIGICLRHVSKRDGVPYKLVERFLAIASCPSVSVPSHDIDIAPWH